MSIKTRIQNKHDLEVNWLKAAAFIPMQGELIVYDIEVDGAKSVLKISDAEGNLVDALPTGRTTPYTYERFKIGDGINTVSDLPFVVDREKLDSIESGAEVNVQVDWTETDTNSDAFIKNKPDIPSIAANAAAQVKNEIISMPRAGEITVTGADYGQDDYASISGERFNDYDDTHGNRALAAGSHAEGVRSIEYDGFNQTVIQNIAGCGCFEIDSKSVLGSYYYYPNFNITDKTITVKGDASAYAIGDIVSIITDTNFDECATIASVSYDGSSKTVITLQEWPNGLVRGGSSILSSDLVKSYVPMTLRVVAKPLVGTTYLGLGAHTEGVGSRALADGAHAEGRETQAVGRYGHTEGRETKAHYAAHAEGWKSQAIGNHAHAEGEATKAFGYNAHAEGDSSTASGKTSHAEGYNTKAEGSMSHAEGNKTQATGYASHAEGDSNVASNNGAHAEGYNTKAIGQMAHAEGRGTVAGFVQEDGTIAGTAAHAEGNNTGALAYCAHAEGCETIANAQYTHAEGFGAKAQGDCAHAEGSNTTASGEGSHAEGENTAASSFCSHAEGSITTASGECSHAEGDTTTASGWVAHAEGYNTTASGTVAHAEGSETIASGLYSHAEGSITTASGECSHAEGDETIAFGDAAHAEGWNTIASGDRSHAEGSSTAALGKRSHAEGYKTIAAGDISHASGEYTIANYDCQFVLGKYNQNKEDTLFEIGNGTSDDIYIKVTWEDYLTELTRASYGHYFYKDSVLYDDSGNYIDDSYFYNGDPKEAYIHDYSRSNAFEVYNDGSAILQTQGEADNAVVINSTLNAKAAEIIEQLHGTGISREVVETLPAIEEANDYTIYMVSNSSDAQNNVYDEYLLVDGTWEMIGSTEVDLTDYCTKDEVYNKTETYNKNEIDTKINAKPGIKDADGGEIFNNPANIASGNLSHAEGNATQALAYTAHAEGNQSKSTSSSSHAEGYKTEASGESSHAEGESTKAIGKDSHAEGRNTQAGEKLADNSIVGTTAHAEGDDTKATAYASHSEGSGTRATGQYSHVEGLNNIAQSEASHAEGRNVRAGLRGFKITSIDSVDHAEGSNCLYYVEDIEGLIETKPTTTYTYRTFINGLIFQNNDYSVISIEPQLESSTVKLETNEIFTSEHGLISHDISNNTYNGYVFFKNSGAEGLGNEIIGNYAHAEGDSTVAYGSRSHAEGVSTIALGYAAHAEGDQTKATTSSAHAEGYLTQATGKLAHAEGRMTIASGYTSHAEGNETTASGNTSHAEGYRTSASGLLSHAEGNAAVASGEDSHAEGRETKSGYLGTHSEGFNTRAGLKGSFRVEAITYNNSGLCQYTLNSVSGLSVGFKYQTFFNSVLSPQIYEITHINTTTRVITTTQNWDESYVNLANFSYEAFLVFSNTNPEFGKYAHAEGMQTQAMGNSAHAEGKNTRANHDYSHAGGLGTITGCDSQTVVGSYNEIDSNALFVVGNGSASTADKRANAFAVKTDGTAELQAQGTTDSSVVIKSYVDEQITALQQNLTLVDRSTGVNYNIYIDNGKLMMEVAE